MKYTGGFDIDEILPALSGRVGFLSDSPTARTYESFHALCTEQNLRDIQPNAGITNTQFSTYKAELNKSLILRSLQSVFSEPSYMEQTQIHSRIPGTQPYTVMGAGKFYGMEIKIAADYEMCVRIPSVTLYFNGVATFNLYLFAEGQQAPLWQKEVTTEAFNHTTVTVDDLYLSYAKSGIRTYYLGYFTDDLGDVQPIREQSLQSPSFCFSAYPCELKKTDTERVDVVGRGFSYDPYGLNAEVQCFRDYTYKIKRQPHLFDEAIGLSMVYYMLEQIVSSTRQNDTERALKGSYEAIELKHYLYGSVPAMGVARTTGLNDVLKHKYREIRQAFHPPVKPSAYAF